MNPATLLLLIRKELRETLRNRWFLLYAAAFAALAMSVSWLSLAGADQYGFAGFNQTAAGLVNLIMLVVPLMALQTGAGSVAGERERGTLGQILSLPVTKAEVLAGKFLGQSLALISALALGFGLSGVVISANGGSAGLSNYLTLAGLSAVLTLAMLSVGLLISAAVRKSSTAVGIAVVAWLALAFASDLGLMGGAILFQLRAWSLFALALFNPLEVFKMAVLSGTHASLDSLGPAGQYAVANYGRAIWALFAASLAAWTVLPLAAAGWLLKRMEVA
ncbi:MAG: ABC transporter permease [Opitutaceae bacterium]